MKTIKLTFNFLTIQAINQNGGFTKVWVSLKTIYFPIVICVLAWYWRRVHMLSRSPALLEYLLLALGIALTFLNSTFHILYFCNGHVNYSCLIIILYCLVPLEYLTLAYDMPFMLLLGDIRQGVFYAILLSFWLVFAGEHLMVRNIA